MIPESIILSIVVGLIRKGNWLHFGIVKIKGFTIVVVGAAIQILVFRLADASGNEVQQFLFTQFYILHLISYILILVPLFVNSNYRSLYIMGMGTLLNLVPIAFNNGKMPVQLNETLSGTHFDIGHVLLTEATRFRWLSDIIFIREPYPFPKIISIGDIFIVIGVFLLIQQIMVNENLSRKLIEM